MIFEDERAPARRPAELRASSRRLHLRDRLLSRGRPGGMQRGRRLRELVRYPNGEKMGDFHLPTDLDDYRTAYRGLSDRSRPAGRARALAVRLRLGQSRILLAGLAKPAAVRQRGPAGADEEGGGQPGLVRISARPGPPAGGLRAGPSSTGRGSATRRSRTSTRTGLGNEPDNLAAIGA